MCWRAFCSLRISCEQSSADGPGGVPDFAWEKEEPTEPAQSPPRARPESAREPATEPTIKNAAIGDLGAE